MRVEQVAIKWAIYIKKKRDKIEKTFLSRNQNLIAISSIGIIACVVSCGLIAIGLIVGIITRCVRSKKKEEEVNGVANCRGNHAVQQDIEKIINQTKVDKELATQNINNFKSIQNTQQVMNLNSLNNNMKIGI